MTRKFGNILDVQWKKSRLFCVGLDSDVSKLPAGENQLSFNKAIVDATSDLAAAYKPNAAFYEAQGAEGYAALKKTIAYIHAKAPEALVILDAKRADIGNTNKGYAQSAFEDFEADAVTLNPYLGGEALEPFLDYADKGCFILCRTSNPGAKEFQDTELNGEPLYLRVARQVAEKWNRNNNCGLVVGATCSEELKKVRAAALNLPFLVPGVGVQGGNVQSVLRNGCDKEGRGLIINVSRSVIFASAAGDFAEKARASLFALQGLVKTANPKFGGCRI